MTATTFTTVTIAMTTRITTKSMIVTFVIIATKAQIA